ncbi:MAG TPA: transporter substrate-binding domain-containing protein [Pirellulales bacterium]|nr:transporter substrate-binding domain-containing protein [Pirellulales bacterium]
MKSSATCSGLKGTHRLGNAAIALALLSSLDVPPARADEKPKVLAFCAEPTAMPRSGKDADGSPRGLDVAIAQMLCRKLGRDFEIHWCASAACSRNCLRSRRCDLILGHPLDEGAPKEIAWSVPYAGCQFGLVVPRGEHGIRSLADAIDKRIGVVAGTVPLPEAKHQVVRFRTREEVLDRFEADALDAAFIDADFAAWHLHCHPDLELRLVEGYVPREHWNLALAARASDAGLLVEINKALAELTESGELKQAWAALGVGYRGPFTPNAGRAAALDAWPRIQERGELRIALDPANLPYSSANEERPGFDLELARDLARRLGLKLRVEWLDVQRETAVGKLLENECDLALGAAIDPNAVEDEEPLAGKVLYSRPYYGTGYLLVNRADGPRVKTLAEIKGQTSRRLGAEAGSVADYRLRQGGYQRSLFRNQLAVLKALDDGAIDYAYLWANVGWTLHTTPEFKLEMVPGFVPQDHWNIAAALRKSDAELKRRVDGAVAAMVDDGTVAQALARYHVPYFPPFTENEEGDEQAAHDDVIRHPVADRGIEPALQMVQTSRRPYSGLERVRSAGALVLGLDQNNLPFSAAHPRPAGLDYEIAGHLAEKLGVSLRVYWAYSSHDSYPSKLATKKQCDVILGVTPDDRFGDRVAYSKPYYVASYQRLVLAGAEGPAEPTADDPLAIEAGVALRGLDGHATQSYSSLDDIFDALSAKKVTAAYVISTRAPWLAQRRWPGKFRFFAGESVDRFPICAAVRKADKDLKAAIDWALAELARSGELARVFDRWQIVYDAPAGEDGRISAAGSSGLGELAGLLPGQTAESKSQTPAERPAEPPAADEQAALAEGQALFRGLCSGCHGGAGRGGKGPDLTDSRWIHGDKDLDIARVIKEGVPKTTMKKLGESLKEEQIARLVGYIRRLARTPGESAWRPYLAGDPEAGRKLFFDPKGKAICSKCHTVKGQGGRIGPPLDRIASRRAPEYIMESILLPSKDIDPNYESVQVATSRGTVITGLRINETNFSIQLREENGRFHSFLKKELDEVAVSKKSLMPDNMPDVLTIKDLHDLFAFLMTLE